MVSSISSSSSMISSLEQLSSSRTPVSTLTDDQKSTISDILSNYDADNISEDDAKEIWQAFQDAGIKPQAGMKEAIESAGFDADNIRTLATGETAPTGAAGGTPPPPPPDGGGFGSSSSISATDLSTLKDILSNYDLSNLSSDDQTNLLSQINAAGLSSLGNLIDLKS